MGDPRPLAQRLPGPWASILETAENVVRQRGTPCRWCKSEFDMVHDGECPVPPALSMVELAHWTLHVERLLAESVASALTAGKGDHQKFVTKQLDLIAKWRADFPNRTR